MRVTKGPTMFRNADSFRPVFKSKNKSTRHQWDEGDGANGRTSSRHWQKRMLRRAERHGAHHLINESLEAA
jgi:hypothetical protein